MTCILFIFLATGVKYAIPAIVPLLIGAAVGIGSGLIKKGKANRDARANTRPEYNTPGYELENLAQIENMASQGLTDTTKRLYSQQADRGLTAALDAVLKGGGNPNNVSGVVQRYLDNTNSIALADEAARLNNIQALLSQRRKLAGYEDKEWMINKYAPFADKAQDIARRKAEGDAQINSGINSLSAGLGSMLSNSNMQGKIGSIFSGGNNGDTGRVAGAGDMGNGSNANGGYLGISQGAVNNALGQYPQFNYYGVDPATLSPSERAMFMKLVGTQY